MSRVFFYNWPTYLATWLSACVIAGFGVRLGSSLVLFAAGTSAAWSLVSLLVSYWVYDRSSLVVGAWLRPLLPARLETWAAVDTGLDAEVRLDQVLPGRCLARLDIYDGQQVSAPSVRRARRLTARVHPATPASPAALPLPDASCDLVAMVFAAHELRAPRLREDLFREARRLLADQGRLLLVEHVRDLPNFVAFGPGFFHFQSRGEWLRLARVAGLEVMAETRVTPFVLVLALEKQG